MLKYALRSQLLRRLYTQVAQPAMLGFDWLIIHLHQSLQVSSATGKQRVLIVRLDAIGDFILWLDAARSLRRLYPAESYEITLLANQDWSEVAEQSGHFAHVWPVDIYRFSLDWAYRYLWIKRIRKSGFSLAIQPTYGRRLFDGDSAIRASAAIHRIGLEADHGMMTESEQRRGNRWYTKLVASEPEQMELQRNALFMRHLGLSDFQANLPKLPIYATVPSELTSQPYYAISPGSRRARKKWPLAHFVEVVRRLYAATGWIGIVCGSADEAPLGHELAQQAQVPMQVWSGRTSLGELIAMIKTAQMVLTNDTSAVHIAAATGVPSVCILGGGHYGRFLPYQIEGVNGYPLPVAVIEHMDCFGCGWHCKYRVEPDQPVPCVANVTVESVWQAIQDVLVTTISDK